MFFNKKKKIDLEEFRDITDDVEESEFVPYSCLYDPRTIITKNGELMQTIRISGKPRSFLECAEDNNNLRATLRASIKKHIPSDSYALWFHTIRREINYSLPKPTHTHDTNDIGVRLHDAWEQHHHFSRQYINEVYVSIVREGQDSDKISIQDFIRGIFPSQDIKWRNNFLDTIFVEISTVTENLCKSLQEYDAKILGIYELNGEYYSEIQEFLEKIINLVDRKMPVTDVDLAYYLTTGEITFGFNAMEVRRSDGRRRFASLLSLKEYKESSLSALDGFLQSPIECIVTQCVDFINPEIALNQYKEQKVLTDSCVEPTLAERFETDQILNSETGSPIDFGQQQVLIFLIADNMRQLETYVRRALDYISQAGLVAIREDIHFEECYWAQLPANFEFIRRLVPTYTDHIGGFSNLQRFPMGQAHHNRWGDAVVTLNTSTQTPYFFNFHEGEHGHTLMASHDKEKGVELLHFLLTMSMKYQPRLVCVGISDAYVGLFRSLGAQTYTPSTSGINPFSLVMNETNRMFIYRWLIMLASCLGTPPTDDAKQIMQQLLQQQNFVSLHDFIVALQLAHPETAQIYSDVFIQGAYAKLFNEHSASATAFHWNLAELTHDNKIFAPLMSLLLQCITDSLDGRPTIIVFEEGLEWIGHTHIARTIDLWLDHVSAKNALCIITTEASEHLQNNGLIPTLQTKIATEIFVGCKAPHKHYPSIMNLSAIEYQLMGLMKLDENQFLIKKKHESLISGITLADTSAFLKSEREKTAAPKANEPNWLAGSFSIAGLGQ